MHFMHSSDLMMPSADGFNGLSWIQFIVVARIMDTECWLAGEETFWQILISDLHYKRKYDPERWAYANKKYVEFLERITLTGFNPEFGGIPVSSQPIVQVNGGTHRLGYLLSKSANIFVPVAWTKKISPTRGAKRYAGMGVERLTQVRKRFERLYGEMRKSITGVMKFKVFIDNEDNIRASIPRDMKLSVSSNQNEPSEMKSLLPNKKSVWQQRLAAYGEDVVIINIELEHQAIHLNGMGGGLSLKRSRSIDQAL